MMIKLTKAEVERACAYWLRAQKYMSDGQVVTNDRTPVGVDYDMQISCKHTRGGVECVVIKKPTK